MQLLIKLAFLISMVGLLFAEERMRAGLWDVITTVDGQPSGVKGGTCYTPAMVEAGNRPVATLKETTEKNLVARGCQLKEFKLEGNKITMSTVCRSRSSTTTTTYTNDAFETTSTSITQGVTSVVNMKGKRTGDCK
jgi:hypothetical protein